MFDRYELLCLILFLTLVFAFAGVLIATAEGCIDGVGEVLGTVILDRGIDIHGHLGGSMSKSLTHYLNGHSSFQ